MRSVRQKELEDFFHENGFISVVPSSIEMCYMFLVIFVKETYIRDVANVSVTSISKGAVRGMIGNKGAIACNFTFMNRTFNIVATHLRHG